MVNLQKGLVGHWTMDEDDTSDGTLYDKSAYGNNATLVNTPTTGISGKIGEAYDFNNANSEYVEGNIDVTAPCTYSIWVNLDVTNNTHLFNIADSNISGEREVGQILVRNGSPLEVFYTTTVDNSDLNQVSGLSSLNTGKWYHIVAVIEDSSNASVYINGELNSSTIADSNYIGGYENDRITVNKDNNGNYADSQVDDFRIYNRALSESEISALYNMRSQRTQTNDLAKGLVGYWTMDDADTSGGTLYDSSARGFHGSLTAESNAPTTSQSSVLGEAYDFSSDDNITFSTNPDFPSVWTLTCWIKPQNVANGNWNTLCRGNDHQVILEKNTGELGMYDNSTGNNFQGSGYDGTQLEGIWSHMAVIGSGETQDYYIDGSFVGSAATQSTTNLNQIGYTGGQSWGLMSNFRLYHRALSQSEISALYNNRT